MKKLLLLAVLAGLVWVGREIHEQGARHAFGGAFAFLAVGDDLPERASEYVSRPQQVARQAQGRIDEGAERYDDLAAD